MMNRRQAIKVCGGLVGAALIESQLGLGLFEGELLAAPGKVKLTDATGAPLKASKLGKDQALLFHYPHQATPAYIVNLGAAVPGKQLAEGQFAGGVGKDKSIVAFLAICPHQLTFAKWDYNMIDYYAKDQTIYCCSHSSTFELKEGATPKAGSAAQQSLVSVLLEHDSATDELYATGIMGPEILETFFKRHKRDLRGKYKSSKNAKAMVTEAKAVPIGEYSKQVACRKS